MRGDRRRNPHPGVLSSVLLHPLIGFSPGQRSQIHIGIYTCTRVRPSPTPPLCSARKRCRPRGTPRPTPTRAPCAPRATSPRGRPSATSRSTTTSPSHRGGGAAEALIREWASGGDPPVTGEREQHHKSFSAVVQGCRQWFDSGFAGFERGGGVCRGTPAVYPQKVILTARGFPHFAKCCTNRPEVPPPLDAPPLPYPAGPLGLVKSANFCSCRKEHLPQFPELSCDTEVNSISKKYFGNSYKLPVCEELLRYQTVQTD